MPITTPDDPPISIDQAWSVRIADSAIARHPLSASQWHYEHGFLLKAIEQVWLRTADLKYWRFIQAVLDTLVGPGGVIKTYRVDEYNLDQINPGRLLFPLYRATGEARYREALHLLHYQLQNQPRTQAGGFWHKQIYPWQMWLDGLYMAAPFYAEFAHTFDEPAAFDDVVHQLVLVEARTRDPKTGLLYHAWDESRQQRWADPDTGSSPHFWGRAVGWYAMALVDVLDYLPAEHPGRPALTAILARLMEAIARVQDPATGVWYQVLDYGGRAGNYREASATGMFVYAIAKGIRMAYLASELLAVARAGYQGLLEQFVTVDEHGRVDLAGTCGVAGLGGDPYRDGSFEYYAGEPVVTNDYKGVGALLLATVEMEQVLTDHAWGAGRRYEPLA